MTERTFRVISFGCKVNQVEGEALRERLLQMRLRESDAPKGAGLVIVNTCAVTAEAARQCRQSIRRALRSGAAVLVTGCYAHPAAADDALRRIGGVWLIEADKARVPERIRSKWANLASPPAAGAEAALATPRSRAMLKVQDGCTACCTYCIVRKVRSTLRSTPLEAAARQLADLVAAGYREIVLCGIHLGLYGADLAPRTNLAELLARLVSTPGLGRLRLSSIEPMEADDDLLGLMASEPGRICPHLHLPLQSGDDGVLARMNRPYTAGEFLSTVARVREALWQPAVTADVQVGFPGETEAAFENTLGVCREAGFARIHVFPFSRRPGTAAAEMDEQIPPHLIRRRRARAAEFGESLARTFRESLIGRPASVVIERLNEGGSAEGLSERYVRVRIPGPLPGTVRRRDIVTVTLRRAVGATLEGEPTAEPNS